MRVLNDLIRTADTRVWASIFLVDLDPSADRRHAVFGVLTELAAARWRGVDARLIVSGSRTNLAMAESAAAAVALANRLAIPTRWIGARARRGSHAKYVVSDDHVLLGSHNWSASSFLTATQDSILVRSPSLASYVAGLFADQWRRPRAEETE